MTGFLNAMKDSLKSAGIKETPAVAERLEQAVLSKDHGEIVRAFHEAIYGRFQRLEKVLPLVKNYLTDDDPFVRFTAARTLYTTGDRAGFRTLISILAANQIISEGKLDLRVEAARVLAQFRENDAASDIAALYTKTKRAELLSVLATLGLRTTQDMQFPYVASKVAITEYAKIGASEFAPNVAATFQQAADPKLKAAAAWALVRFGQKSYTSYLAQLAQTAIDESSKSSGKVDEHTVALRYVGSLQTPEAREVLERAVDSNNPVAVQYAIVNLLFNQPGGSEKAKQVVLRELRGEQRKLGVDLMLNVASQLDDPEIRAAGEAFEKSSGDKSWQLYSVERRNWPIYNWIDDYVVALK